MFVRGILASKKAPCYFYDICGHLEASLGFFFSKVVNLVKFVILALFATFVRGVLRTKHTLVYLFLFKLIQLAYTLLIFRFLRYLPIFRGLSWLPLFHYLVTFAISAISAS